VSHKIKQPIAGAITSANSCRLWLERDVPNIDKALAALDRIEKDGTGRPVSSISSGRPIKKLRRRIRRRRESTRAILLKTCNLLVAGNARIGSNYITSNLLYRHCTAFLLRVSLSSIKPPITMAIAGCAMHEKHVSLPEAESRPQPRSQQRPDERGTRSRGIPLTPKMKIQKNREPFLDIFRAQVRNAKE